MSMTGSYPKDEILTGPERRRRWSVAEKLENNENFPWYSVEAENFESIHNHSAFAQIEQFLRTADPEIRDTPQDRRRFQLALARFRGPELVDRALGMTLTNEVATQDVGPMLIGALANPAGRERAWHFITRRWEQLARRLPPMMISRLVEATPALQTPGKKREVSAFFRLHPVPTARRALRQALERFDLNNDLTGQTASTLARWLGTS